MANGIDYSFSRPPAATIAAQGYTTVGRYLASSSGKRLSGTEAASLQAAGLSIFLVFEDFANPLDNNPSMTDFNSGVADGTLALGQANALGVPSSRPIYVAVDTSLAYSPNDTGNALWGRYANYFSGFASIVGTSRVGLYGGGQLWSYLFGAGIIGPWFWQAAAASWNSYVVPYPGALILQGLGNPIAGYSTDPDTTYVNDWGQWPAPNVPPPPPVIPPGGTYTADVSQTDTSYAQTDKHSLITPLTGNDQIIYSVTTSDATLASGSHNAFYEIPTNIKQTAYPIGIFSYDGGITWNDFGFSLPVAPSVAGVYPGVELQPSVDSSGNIFFNGVNNTGATVSLIIKIALLATYAPSLLPTPPVIEQDLSYTNVSPTIGPFYPPYSSYRRIALDNATQSSSLDVAHGQSGIPNIMFWVDVGGFTTINPVGWASNGSYGALGIRMDATNVHFHVDSGTYNNCFYRVYKDNT